MLSPIKKISSALIIALACACSAANAIADDSAPKYVLPFTDAQMMPHHKKALAEKIRARLDKCGIQRTFVPPETFGELFRARNAERCGAIDPRFALGDELTMGADEDAFSIPVPVPVQNPMKKRKIGETIRVGQGQELEWMFGDGKTIPIRIDYRYPEADGNVWEFGVARFDRITQRLFFSYALSKELTLGAAMDLFDKIRIAGGLQRFPKKHPEDEYCETEASAFVLVGSRTDEGKEIFTDAGVVVRMIPIRGFSKYPEKYRVSVGAACRLFSGGNEYSQSTFLKAVVHDFGDEIKLSGGRRLCYYSPQYGKPLRVSGIPDFFRYFTERREK